MDINQTPLSSSLLLSTSMASIDTPITRDRVDDLFTAHDFDISIDLPTAAQGTVYMTIIIGKLV